MAQPLLALAAVAEDMELDLSTYISLKIVYKSRSRGSTGHFWLPWAQSTYVEQLYMQTNYSYKTKTIRKKGLSLYTLNNG